MSNHQVDQNKKDKVTKIEIFIPLKGPKSQGPSTIYLYVVFNGFVIKKIL